MGYKFNRFLIYGFGICGMFFLLYGLKEIIFSKLDITNNLIFGSALIIIMGLIHIENKILKIGELK